MIIITRQTAEEMKTNNSSYVEIEDVYDRKFLVGTGAEFLILDENDELLNHINEQKAVLNGNI